VYRVARQLGYGVESVRSWVRQADIDDGYEPGVTTTESARVKELAQEIRELKRANEILKRVACRVGHHRRPIAVAQVDGWCGVGLNFDQPIPSEMNND